MSIGAERHGWPALALLLLSGIAYVYLSYITVRSDFGELIALFAFLFAAYLVLYRLAKNERVLRWCMLAAVFFRISLLFCTPNLSDDYWRFFWDGAISAEGISPFAVLPQEALDQQISPSLDQAIFEQLNSPNYYTIYPPVNQAVFLLAAKLFPQSVPSAVLVMKFFLLLCEFGSLFLLWHMLAYFQVHRSRWLLYALNPLVIIELSANCHFEAAMIFFSLLAFWFLLPKAPPSSPLKLFEAAKLSSFAALAKSAIAMSLAVCSKLLPLVFLPFLLKRLGIVKTAFYGLVMLLMILLLYVPLLNADIISNMMSSVDLYFHKFEFNASMYYVVRAIGYKIYGWNIIATAGSHLARATLVLILAVAFLQRDLSFRKLATSWMFALLIYFGLATIVHPWYLTTLVAYCVLSPYRFPIVWSALAVLSYYTYISDAYTESLLLVAVEYSLVYGYLLWELVRRE